MKPITIWLFSCAFMVFAMMVIGAVTRLTESGLSMVEWRPLIGALPPMNEAEWERVFALYQQTPEYQKINSWMGIADFKQIFFWEWFHRLWGRLIGLVYALPMAFFWVRGMIPREDRLKFIGLLLLGAAQGVMGWYMVASGLVDRPSVSHYRLAAHLGLAFLVLGCLIWMGLRYSGMTRTPDKSLYVQGLITLGALIITIFWGAYTAGLDAGLLYNEWPLMGGSFVPEDMWHLSPAFTNIFENPAAVQFTHRWLAIIAAGFIIAYSVRAMKRGHKHPVIIGLKIMVLLQVMLGIVTLLTNVHIHVAAAHQAGAAILFSLMVASLYRVRG